MTTKRPVMMLLVTVFTNLSPCIVLTRTRSSETCRLQGPSDSGVVRQKLSRSRSGSVELIQFCRERLDGGIELLLIITNLVIQYERGCCLKP
jgi:hypothetical protein